MKTWIRLIAWTGMVLLLSGCWSNMELTQRAFVIGIALDKGEKNDLELTVQIYKPVSQFGAPSVQDEKSAFINVTLEGSSVFTIIRNNKAVTGRRSQFSHTQVLLIGEELAKEQLSGILDFFYRDPEIRLGTPIMIAQGKARDFLTGKSLIENTLGSQVQKQLNFSATLAGKTINTNLMDLAFQLKSESESALLPVIAQDSKFHRNLVHGIALVKKDKMIGKVAPDKAPYLLMLANRYRNGVVEIPCGRESSRGETFEIIKENTTMTPKIQGDDISVAFDVQIQGSIGELSCTTIRDMADEKKYEAKLERYFKEQLESVLNNLKKQKTDAVGIGHKLYLRHPSRWKKIKPDWPERYARIPADIRVKVTITNSKIMNPSPFAQVGED